MGCLGCDSIDGCGTLVVLLHSGFLGGAGEGGKGSYVGFWFWGVEFSLGVVEQEFGFRLRYYY